MWESGLYVGVLRVAIVQYKMLRFVGEKDIEHDGKDESNSDGSDD